ncbi:nucleotide sugar dehydrogenase, partial [Candidatus Pelagibacter sp.]|nr:nucleotide sugar dehydrogenase [Candidatus Pelagibacter sp.]
MKSSKTKVCIIGLGYTGLPLAIYCKYKGFDVTGVDIDKKKIELIKKKNIKINDINISKIFKKTNIKLSLTVTPANIFVICLPTPVDEYNNPDLSFLITAIKMINKVVKDKDLIIIESTIYPGLSEEIILPKIKKSIKNVYLAHCPERINPGDNKWSISNIPRVLGAINKQSLKIAYNFYLRLIGKKNILKVSSIRVAESCKVFENIFRDVNIALVNEMAQAFFRMNIDTKEVIKACSSKPFSFMPHWPGIGVGGHCIAVDPYYMIERGRVAGFDHDFLKLARKINSNMPIYSLNLLQNSLNEIGKSISKTKIGVYGLAYKPNVNDKRESPSLEILKRLKEDKGANVKVYDPYFQKDSDFKKLNDLLKWAEAIIICTAHDEIVKMN